MFNLKRLFIGILKMTNNSAVGKQTYISVDAPCAGEKFGENT